MKNKQLEKYIKSNKFQKDCAEFNEKFVNLLNNHSDDLSEKKFFKFAEVILPTILIGHISNFFKSITLEHDEEAVDCFVGSIKKTIMQDCKIEETSKDYTMIDDIGAVA